MRAAIYCLARACSTWITLCSQHPNQRASAVCSSAPEFFNVFNHPNFGNPSTTFNTSSFGSITGTTTDNRDIQFGLKLSF